MLIYIVLFLDAKSKLCCSGYLTLQRSVTGHHPCCETMHDLFPLSTTSSSRAFGMHNIRSWRWTCRSSPRLFRKTQHVRPPSNFFLLLSLSRCCSCYTPQTRYIYLYYERTVESYQASTKPWIRCYFARALWTALWVCRNSQRHHYWFVR